MKVLLVATVQSHICQFHRPLVAMLHEHGCEVHVAARNNLAEKNGLKHCSQDNTPVHNTFFFLGFVVIRNRYSELVNRGVHFANDIEVWDILNPFFQG